VGLDRRPRRLNTWTYSLTNRLTAKTGAGPDEQPVRWELARLVLAQTFDDDAGRRPLGDLTGDLIIDPNRYLRLRADAAYSPTTTTRSSAWTRTWP